MERTDHALSPIRWELSGAVDLAEYFGGPNGAIEMSPRHLTDMVVSDGVVTAIGVEEHTLVLPAGKRYALPFVRVIRFDANDKVTHVREYNDTREMLAASRAD